MAARLQKTQNQPLHTMFRFLQIRTRVQVWLYDQPQVRLEGTILGFDEYMNLVLDGTEEVVKGKGGSGERRNALGRLLLKGDNITAILGAPGKASEEGGGSGSGSGSGSGVAAGGGGGGGGEGGGGTGAGTTGGME